MKYKYAIIFVLIILLINLTGCFIFPPINNTTEWTVMVYLDADNNLESAGIDDINEMEIVGSTTEVNVVVQVDRIPYSVLAANNEGISVFFIFSGTGLYILKTIVLRAIAPALSIKLNISLPPNAK